MRPTSKRRLWTNPKGGTLGIGIELVRQPPFNRGCSVFAGSTSGTATVTLDGNQSASALQFGDSSAAGSYTIGPGTARRVDLGHVNRRLDRGRQRHECDLRADRAGREPGSEPVGRSFFELGNISQGTSPAALSLSGDGQLVLSGSDNYTGGTTVFGGTLYVTNSQRLARRIGPDRGKRCDGVRRVVVGACRFPG